MSRKQSFSKKKLSTSKSRIIPISTSSSDDEVDNEEIFEVECILDKRIVAGQVSVRAHIRFNRHLNAGDNARGRSL